jgi:flagellar biosynthesis protein FlhB
MAETDLEDRTEQPTQKRLDDARREGQIPRSRDLSAAAVMLVAGVALQMLGGVLGGRMADLMRSGLQLSRAEALDDGRLVPALGDAGLQAMIAIAPILGLTLVAALGAPLLMGGWAFSGAAMAPKFERLDPIAGVGRMFSARAWMELVKSLAKFAVVAAAGVIVLRANLDELMGLGSEPMGAAIGHAASITGQALVALCAALIVIAGVDVPFQLWQHNRELRMTREEIKQESKESEGSPEVKAQIRRLQRERAERRMMADVPKADVIIVNPTHYAVALRYDDTRDRAPVVVAKGVDHMAAKIREVATENQVPIFEAPPLARALHRTVEIGDEIPSSLYVVVAQVLTYIFQLRTARRERRQPPPAPVIDFTE